MATINEITQDLANVLSQKLTNEMQMCLSCLNPPVSLNLIVTYIPPSMNRKLQDHDELLSVEEYNGTHRCNQNSPVVTLDFRVEGTFTGGDCAYATNKEQAQVHINNEIQNILNHEIKQILAAAQRITFAVSPSRPLTTAETDSIIVFAQGVFKRFYELSLSEPLRLETFVAMLEAVNKCFPQLGQDLGTWATYAPTETESQIKIHRTVLLLLLRSHLVNFTELDEYLSHSMDGTNCKSA